MADPTGRIQNVKALLESMVTNAVSYAHVSRDSRDGPDIMHMPFCSIRVGPILTSDMNYGRRCPERGSYEIVNFSMHCFASNAGGINEKAKYAHEFADAIKDYMITHKRAYTTTNEVHDIYDLSIRESAPTSYALSRVILEGKLLVKRKDSP